MSISYKTVSYIPITNAFTLSNNVVNIEIKNLKQLGIKMWKICLLKNMIGIESTTSFKEIIEIETFKWHSHK